MDRLFLEDNLRSRAILASICRYLSLPNQLELEAVSLLTQSVVQEQVRQEMVYFDWPLGKLLKLACTHHGNQKYEGPIIKQLHVTVHVQSASHDLLAAWKWLLTELACRAPHLLKLKIRLFLPTISGKQCDELNKLADRLLSGITFNECVDLAIWTQLTITDGLYYKFLPRHLLSHFPALESLSLEGDHLPPISYLPAPETLLGLHLRLKSVGCPKFDKSFQAISVDFKEMQSLEIHTNHVHEPVYLLDFPDALMAAVTGSGRDDPTGIKWSESFTQHPPAHLESITLPSLSAWNMPLLRSCAPTCRSLKLGSLSRGSVRIVRKLKDSLPDGKLATLTTLEVRNLDSVMPLNAFLGLTSSLQQLDVHVSADYHEYHELPFLWVPQELPSSLPSLEKLTVKDVYRRLGLSWIYSVRSVAPAGLDWSPTMDHLTNEPP